MATIPGMGTKLFLGESIGAPSTATTTGIGQITNISGPNAEVSTRDTTLLIDTAKRYERAILDGGEVTFTVLFTTATGGYARLRDVIDGTTPVSTLTQGTAGAAGEYFRLEMSTSDTAATFHAIPTGLNITGMEPEGTVMGELALKITGLPTLP